MLVRSLIHLGKVCMLSHVRFFVTPWAAAHQAPVSMQFSRQEYWSGLLFLSPRILPNPGIEPTSPVSPASTGEFFTSVPPVKTFDTFPADQIQIIKHLYIDHFF